MTENAFAAPAAVDEPTTRKPLVIAGGVAAALVLGAGGYFLLAGGSSSKDPAFPISKGKPRQVATVPVATPAAKPATVLPATSTAALGRDPFLALYVIPAVAPVTATPASPAPGTVPPAGGTPAGGTSAPPAAPTTKTYAMRLARVTGTGTDQTATFTFDGKAQTAKLGGSFGPTSEVKLVSLQQDAKGAWTAVVQVGDGQPFDVLAGETLYVR